MTLVRPNPVSSQSDMSYFRYAGLELDRRVWLVTKCTKRTDRGEDSLTRLPATAVRDSFSETVNRVAYQGERIALERHGKTVAALVTVEDLELLQALADRIDLAVARRALKERGRLDWTIVKAGLGL